MAGTGAAETDWARACLEAFANGAATLASVQAQHASNPTAVRPRVELIGIYTAARDPAVVARAHEHIAWLAEHHPEVYLLSLGSISRGTYAVAHDRVSAIWQRHVANQPSDERIYLGAVEFHRYDDPAYARGVVDECVARFPRNPYWRTQRIWFDRREGTISDDKLCEDYTNAIKLSAKLADRARLMNEYARASVVSNPPRARSLAAAVLRALPKLAQDREYGSVVHDAHIVLGLCAVPEGALEEATRHLITAGGSPPSPVLSVYGPDLELAQRLLAAGQRAAVVEFFTLASTMAPSNASTYATWSAAIERGETPALHRYAIYVAENARGPAEDAGEARGPHATGPRTDDR